MAGTKSQKGNRSGPSSDSVDQTGTRGELEFIPPQMPIDAGLKSWLDNVVIPALLLEYRTSLDLPSHNDNELASKLGKAKIQ
jgi:hypothetical protein